MIRVGDRIFVKFNGAGEVSRYKGKAYIYESMENGIRYMTKPEMDLGYLLVEYRPNIHGRWIQTGVDKVGNVLFECNVCHNITINNGNFCSCCGSDMDMKPEECLE